MLLQLEQGGWIRSFEHEGKSYFAIRNWDKHQRLFGREKTQATPNPLPPKGLWNSKTTGSDVGCHQGDTPLSPGCHQGDSHNGVLEYWSTGVLEKKEIYKEKVSTLPEDAEEGTGEYIGTRDEIPPDVSEAAFEEFKNRPKSLTEAMEKIEHRCTNENLQKTMKVPFEPDERMQLIGGCHGDPNQKWSYFHCVLFQEVDPPLEDCQTMARFYSHRQKSIDAGETYLWKTDRTKLLTEWGDQLTRASDRKFSRVQKPKKEVALPEQVVEPVNWYHFFEYLYPDAADLHLSRYGVKWNWADLNKKHPDVVKEVLKAITAQ